ncbi:hypothetical protein DFJ73DRAFT_779620 [Zopfochytrium polystomum]|nr:hypothetical protein DFJ73DRAFT_779620 [Zopfochytrium polystomum]
MALEILSGEAAALIFSELCVRDIFQASLVCRALRRAANVVAVRLLRQIVRIAVSDGTDHIQLLIRAMALHSGSAICLHFDIPLTALRAFKAAAESVLVRTHRTQVIFANEALATLSALKRAAGEDIFRANLPFPAAPSHFTGPSCQQRIPSSQWESASALATPTQPTALPTIPVESQNTRDLSMHEDMPRPISAPPTPAPANQSPSVASPVTRTTIPTATAPHTSKTAKTVPTQFASSHRPAPHPSAAVLRRLSIRQTESPHASLSLTSQTSLLVDWIHVYNTVKANPILFGKDPHLKRIRSHAIDITRALCGEQVKHAMRYLMNSLPCVAVVEMPPAVTAARGGNPSAQMGRHVFYVQTRFGGTRGVSGASSVASSSVTVVNGKPSSSSSSPPLIATKGARSHASIFDTFDVELLQELARSLPTLGEVDAWGTLYDEPDDEEDLDEEGFSGQRRRESDAVTEESAKRLFGALSKAPVVSYERVWSVFEHAVAASLEVGRSSDNVSEGSSDLYLALGLSTSSVRGGATFGFRGTLMRAIKDCFVTIDGAMELSERLRDSAWMAVLLADFEAFAAVVRDGFRLIPRRWMDKLVAAALMTLGRYRLQIPCIDRMVEAIVSTGHMEGARLLTEALQMIVAEDFLGLDADAQRAHAVAYGGAIGTSATVTPTAVPFSNVIQALVPDHHPDIADMEQYVSVVEIAVAGIRSGQTLWLPDAKWKTLVELSVGRRAVFVQFLQEMLLCKQALPDRVLQLAQLNGGESRVLWELMWSRVATAVATAARASSSSLSRSRLLESLTCRMTPSESVHQRQAFSMALQLLSVPSGPVDQHAFRAALSLIRHVSVASIAREMWLKLLLSTVQQQQQEQEQEQEQEPDHFLHQPHRRHNADAPRALDLAWICLSVRSLGAISGPGLCVWAEIMEWTAQAQEDGDCGWGGERFSYHYRKGGMERGGGGLCGAGENSEKELVEAAVLSAGVSTNSYAAPPPSSTPASTSSKAAPSSTTTPPVVPTYGGNASTGSQSAPGTTTKPCVTTTPVTSSGSKSAPLFHHHPHPCTTPATSTGTKSAPSSTTTPAYTPTTTPTSTGTKSAPSSTTTPTKPCTTPVSSTGTKSAPSSTTTPAYTPTTTPSSTGTKSAPSSTTTPTKPCTTPVSSTGTKSAPSSTTTPAYTPTTTPSSTGTKSAPSSTTTPTKPCTTPVSSTGTKSAPSSTTPAYTPTTTPASSGSKSAPSSTATPTTTPCTTTTTPASSGSKSAPSSTPVYTPTTTPSSSGSKSAPSSTATPTKPCTTPVSSTGTKSAPSSTTTPIYTPTTTPASSGSKSAASSTTTPCTSTTTPVSSGSKSAPSSTTPAYTPTTTPVSSGSKSAPSSTTTPCTSTTTPVSSGSKSAPSSTPAYTPTTTPASSGSKSAPSSTTTPCTSTTTPVSSGSKSAPSSTTTPVYGATTPASTGNKSAPSSTTTPTTRKKCVPKTKYTATPVSTPAPSSTSSKAAGSTSSTPAGGYYGVAPPASSGGNGSPSTVPLGGNYGGSPPVSTSSQGSPSTTSSATTKVYGGGDATSTYGGDSTSSSTGYGGDATSSAATSASTASTGSSASASPATTSSATTTTTSTAPSSSASPTTSSTTSSLANGGGPSSSPVAPPPPADSTTTTDTPATTAATSTDTPTTAAPATTATSSSSSVDFGNPL